MQRFILIFIGLVFVNTAVFASLPPETRKELSDLSKELKEVSQLIRKKEVDKAKELVQKAEDRVKELAIPEDEKDRAWTSFRSALEKAKNLIPVSFEKEVAPILTANCTDCHGAARASCNLRLDTFNGLVKGGQSGQIVVPKNPNRSLLALRLIHPEEMKRMPQGQDKLSDEEILTVARWIEQGAAFDGENMDAKVGDSLVEKKEPVKVTMADGTETVSFTKDIAPWMVNLCAGCHSGETPRGKFALATFEQLLEGGPTGNTIVPGNPDESYIVDLVLRQDPIKMPQGQAQLKRSQAEALATWIREGAKFDGRNPKALLRDLVPSEAEMEADRLAKMSDTEFEERRKEQAATLWKRVSPRVEATSVETTNFLLNGTAEETRLKQLGDVAEAHLAELQKKFPLPATGQAAFRGRLILFITKDRFDYEEFNTVLMNRRTPRSVSGHSVINANFETAYVAMHDVGDESTDTALSANELLRSLIARTYIARDGTNLPEWVSQGFGLMESGVAPDSAYMKALPERVGESMKTITDPARLFANGALLPEEVTDVGFLLVRFLISQGGDRRFQSFVNELRSNPDVAAALQKSFNASSAELGQAFLRSGGR